MFEIAVTAVNASAIPVPIETIIASIQHLFSIATWLVGGFSGLAVLYVIYSFLQWRERLAVTIMVRDVRASIAEIKDRLATIEQTISENRPESRKKQKKKQQDTT